LSTIIPPKDILYGFFFTTNFLPTVVWSRDILFTHIYTHACYLQLFMFIIIVYGHFVDRSKVI